MECHFRLLADACSNAARPPAELAVSCTMHARRETWRREGEESDGRRGEVGGGYFLERDTATDVGA